MSEEDIEKKVKIIIEKIDNYNQTLEALIGFSHVLRWDDEKEEYKSNSYSFIARRMNTSINNRISPENEITPDLIVQLDNNYGIVSESKKSFPQNRELWIGNFKQLHKYDDDLKGWKTANELISKSDIVLLTHYKIKVDISDYLIEQISNESLYFNRNFTAISFHRTLEANTFLSFEKFYGDLYDTVLNERFRRIVSIPLKIIIPLSKIKFYDDKPELPYIMEILWNKIFSQYPKMEEFMESGGIKIMTIEVNVDDLTQKLREQFSDYFEGDSRQPQIPKTKWVKEAMDMLVKLNYAKKDETSEKKYIVRYKSINNTILRFSHEIYGSTNDKQKTITNFV